MKYTHAKQVGWNGLTFRTGVPFQTSDNRWRTKVTLLGLNGKPLFPTPKVISAPIGAPQEQLQCLLPKHLTEIALSHGNLLVEQARSSSQLTLSLQSYAALREKEIQLYCKWGSQAEKRWKSWADICPVFGSMSITASADETEFENRMETITHRKRRKTGIGEEERNYWIILGGILQYATEVDFLLDDNPLKKIMADCKEKLSTLASKDLARQSLSHAELSSLLIICNRNAETSPPHAAMFLQVLSGLTIPELCGLNCGDWKRQNGISWLEISRAYTQARGAEPILTNRLFSGNAYRRYPCTPAVEQLLRQQIHRQKAAGHGGNTDPLFSEGPDSRLTPDTYKSVLRKTLDPIIQEGAHLYFTERNSFLKGDDRPSIFHGDLLRSTAEYCYRNICKMNVSEIAAILGTDREHTFAISYVDWGNEQVLMYLREKINRWHALQIQYFGEYLRRGRLICGTAEPGAVLRISSPYGVDCVLKPLEDNTEWKTD